MMKFYLWIFVLSSIAIFGTTIGIATAQLENSSQNITGPDTTAAIINSTNASSSLEEAKNMSAIEGTMNQTG
ncbi:hypothetical protein BH18THE1_BH18THE1_10040 [soil metagenome]